MTSLTPRTHDEWRDILRGNNKVRVCGGGTAGVWLPELKGTVVSSELMNRVVEYRPDDLLIRVESGMNLAEMSELVARDGLCLPLLRDRGWLGYAGQTVGGMVAMGLPHYGAGSVRDWVVGMKFITGGGAVVDSGANVVKSVAGFDLHRLLVGSRGELGAILEVALRLYPLKMMPEVPAEWAMQDETWVHRVSRSFECAGEVRSPNREWLWSNRLIDLPPQGWAIGSGGRFVGTRDSTRDRLRANLKNVLDGRGVFGEGWRR